MGLHKALHNEQLCNALAEQKKWPDWVAITAFYSALHFVDSTLFPLDTRDHKRFYTIDDYSVHHGGTRSKHTVRMNLVESRLRPIHPSFRYLFDRSLEMRYGNSIGDDTLADTAVKHLRHLKKHCV